MEDIFQKRAIKNFIELCELFIDNISKIWDDCEATKDYKTLFLGMIKGNESKEQEMIKMWAENMNIPLSKKVKYAKAVERITSSPVTCYHACEYRDIDALAISSSSEILETLDIFNKYKENKMTDEDKLCFWKFLSEINESCFRALGKSTPVIPSRDEIQANIKQNKKTDNSEQPSMIKAFHMGYNNLCSKLNAESIIPQNSSEDKVKEILNRWSDYSKDSCDTTKMTILCNNKDSQALICLNKHFPELKLEGATLTDEVWDIIIQLNGYATVGNSIPSKMMGKIEDLASKLADDIVNGKTDMSSMNLANIGQQVLAGCDESDMNKFASNIEDIIPALQNFQKGHLS